jgi:hypothetical protein
MTTSLNPFPFPVRLPALTNITPFTYRDGMTYLDVLEAMRHYITVDLVPGLDAAIEAVGSTIIENRDEYDALLQVALTEIERRIQTINNKSGGLDIQRLTLPATITVDTAWPTNLPVSFVVKQDAAGTRALTLGANIVGTVDVDQTPNAVTEFSLIPDGTGKWYVAQLPTTRQAFDARVASLTVPVLEALRDDVDDVTTLAGGKSRNTVSTYAARPSAATRANGDTHYASDIRELFMAVGGVWEVVSPPGLLGSYPLTNVAQRLPSSGTDVDWKDVENFSVTFTAGTRPVVLELSGNIATGYSNTTGRASIWLGGQIRAEVKAEIQRAVEWQTFTRKSAPIYGLTPGQSYTAQVRLAPDTSRGADMSWTRLDGNVGDPTVLTVQAV